MPAPKQHILPFAAQSGNRKEPFSSDAEAAAIFALSELERKTGGLTGRQEKIVYITKVGYPLWLVVRGGFTYVFDGLNKSSFLWSYYEASQTEFVINDFEASFRIREKYNQFLSTYQKSFQQTINKKELTCQGLIANNEFLSEIEAYKKEAAEIVWQVPDLGLLSPVLKETDANAIANQIETLQDAFREKTENLQQLTQLIFKTTNRYIEGLRFESDAVSDEAEAKIKAQKEIINPKIEKITSEYKKQKDDLEKSIEREQAPLEKQKSSLEKAIKTKEAELERFRKQARTQANKNNKYSEESLKKKIKKEKQELDETEKQFKIVEKRLKTLVDQEKEESQRIGLEFDRKIKVERQPIVSLEASRDEKLQVFRREIAKLEKLTKPVLEELDRIVKQRQAILTKVEPLALKSDVKLKSNALLYVPFYVAAYNGAGSKRYFIVPPAAVASLGFSSKLKGALGRAKIKDLLNPRFAVTAFLAEKIRLNAASSSEFEAQIETVAQKNNLLNANAQVKNGLFSLKSEGWISDAEVKSFGSAVDTV
jgi:hypothetical protein